MFTAKKQVVDMFIDQVAAKVPAAPKSAPAPAATKSSSGKQFEGRPFLQALAQEVAPREMASARKTEPAFNLPSITNTFGLSGKFDLSGKDVSMPSANIGGAKLSPDVVGKATKFVAPPDGSKNPNQTDLSTNKGKLTMLPGFGPILPKQPAQQDSMAQQQQQPAQQPTAQQPPSASQANKPAS